MFSSIIHDTADGYNCHLILQGMACAIRLCDDGFDAVAQIVPLLALCASVPEDCCMMQSVLRFRVHAQSAMLTFDIVKRGPRNSSVSINMCDLRDCSVLLAISPVLDGLTVSGSVQIQTK